VLKARKRADFFSSSRIRFFFLFVGFITEELFADSAKVLPFDQHECCHDSEIRLLGPSVLFVNFNSFQWVVKKSKERFASPMALQATPKAF